MDFFFILIRVATVWISHVIMPVTRRKHFISSRTVTGQIFAKDGCPVIQCYC